MLPYVYIMGLCHLKELHFKSYAGCIQLYLLKCIQIYSPFISKSYL